MTHWSLAAEINKSSSYIIKNTLGRLIKRLMREGHLLGGRKDRVGDDAEQQQQQEEEGTGRRREKEGRR